MRNNTELKTGGLKVWVAPKLQVIKAGSAENGNGTTPDGGGPGASRS